MLRIEKVRHAVVWTIDRPEAKNALDAATLAALGEAIANVGPDVRAAILTGAGDTFASGGDLRELQGKDTPEEAAAFSDLGWRLTTALEALPIPVLAALPGAAIGGGAELAVACDLRIAETCAYLSFKHTRMGVTTAWGTVPRLLSLVSAGTAARLLYAGHSIDANEAKEHGLVDHVVPPEESLEAALAWAEEIAKASPAANAGMKRLVRASSASLAEIRTLERTIFAQTWTGDEHKDAVLAYFAGRRPHWQE